MEAIPRPDQGLRDSCRSTVGWRLTWFRILKIQFLIDEWDRSHLHVIISRYCIPGQMKTHWFYEAKAFTARILSQKTSIHQRIQSL
jgi:hypothetical protein